MTGAQAVVTHVFASSGVKIRWTQSSTALRIEILNLKLPNLHSDTIGFAVLIPPGASSYAGVSLPAAIELAKREEAPLSAVLGTAIAHEIGHVMLRTSAHASAGVMSPKLDHHLLQMALSGSLFFTAGQSRQLRTAAMQRSVADFVYGH